MKKDWMKFDRRMGHGRVEILIPITRIIKGWSRLFAGFGGREAPVYKPDDIDRAIDKAFEEMGNGS